MTTAQQTEAAAEAPEQIKHHWIMTVQFDHGRQTATYDGSVNVAPGVHTRMATYTYLREHMQQTVGTEQLVVLFFDLAPDQL